MQCKQSSKSVGQSVKRIMKKLTMVSVPLIGNGLAIKEKALSFKIQIRQHLFTDI